VLTNACYDELRRRQRHARLRPFSIDAYSSETDPGDKLVSQDITAEDSLEQVELSDTIRRCLDIMPRSQSDPWFWWISWI
jgi:DNA-directed RNA polymerase specialized sigma24 family protein